MTPDIHNPYPLKTVREHYFSGEFFRSIFLWYLTYVVIYGVFAVIDLHTNPDPAATISPPIWVIMVIAGPLVTFFHLREHSYEEYLFWGWGLPLVCTGTGLFAEVKPLFGLPHGEVVTRSIFLAVAVFLAVHMGRRHNEWLLYQRAEKSDLLRFKQSPSAVL